MIQLFIIFPVLLMPETIRDTEFITSQAYPILGHGQSASEPVLIDWGSIIVP